MRRMRKIVSMLLCLSMCFCLLSMDTKAAGARDGEIVDGTLLTSDASSMGSSLNMARGTYLASGTCALEILSKRLVRISGNTLCNRYCDAVVVNLYLERLEGDTWTSVEQKYQTEYNTASASYETTVTITPGYYYRLWASHVVQKGDVVESNHSETRGVYIG